MTAKGRGPRGKTRSSTKPVLARGRAEENGKKALEQSGAFFVWGGQFSEASVTPRGMWPFSKPDPFCVHIIASLAAHPDDWKLTETRTQTGWREGAVDDEGAEKLNETRWNGHTWVARYRYPVWQPALQLAHAGGDIILRDPDAANYAGWVIEKPAHVLTSKADSKRLSEAVKQWREGYFPRERDVVFGSSLSAFGFAGFSAFSALGGAGLRIDPRRRDLPHFVHSSFMLARTLRQFDASMSVTLLPRIPSRSHQLTTPSHAAFSASRSAFSRST